ncbi:MAG: ankyrin repeat protein [Saprospiraceae bacterium]|jgi:ankyrin repeat protein
MKRHKIISLKTLFSFSLIVTLIVSACAQSSNSTNAQSENKTKAKSIVEKPKIGIQAAIISNNLEIVKQHIEAGTDINMKDQMSGSTPLISAATFGKTDIIKALIDAKADLSIKNNDGATALHSAAFFCRIEIVQLLINAKADKTIKNNFGMTARESVMGPFTEIKPIYEMLQQQLSPLGLQIDLNELEKTRPVIAMMLQ